MTGTKKQIAYATSLKEKELARLQERVDRKLQEGKLSYRKETYVVRNTGEKLELTKLEAMQLSMQLIQNMTNANEIIDALEYPIVYKLVSAKPKFASK